MTQPAALDEILRRAAARYPDDLDGDDAPLAYVGRDVPRELLVATGWRPVRVAGRPAAASAADRYCGSGIDAVARSQLARILAGELARTSGLVISADCEGSVRLFLYLREIHRLDGLPHAPRFTFADVVHLPHLTSIRYTRTRLVELAATLRQWTGSLDEAALPSAIAAANRARRAGRAVHRLRVAPDGPSLTGVEALHLTAAGLRTRPDEFVALVEQVSEAAAGRPPRDGVRVFFTGSAHDVDGVYRHVESRGAIVVGEDHDWGDLAWAGHVAETGDPFTALAEAYSRGAPSAAGYGIAERAAHTSAAAVEARAQLVIAWLREGDDAPAWDVARQRAALAEHDIPLVALPAQPYTAEPLPAAARLLDDALAAAGARA